LTDVRPVAPPRLQRAALIVSALGALLLALLASAPPAV
jgi:hypothetical protein